MPVYESHLVVDYDELGLGVRIRKVRHELGLTLADLSKRSGMSMARLSRIENNIHVPNVDEAAILAESLEIPSKSLLPVDEGLPYQLTRDGRMQTHAPTTPVRISEERGPAQVPHHNQIWPVADAFVGRHMDPVLVRVQPVPDGDVRFYRYHEEVFGFVLRGTVELSMKLPDGGVRSETLGPGDCAYYRSDVPHCLRALNGEPAETLHIRASTAPIETRHHASWTVHVGDDEPPIENQRRHAIAKRVSELREQNGWTLAQVADRAGLKERQVLNIEKAQRSVRLDVVIRVARAFGRPVHEFLGGSRQAGPPLVAQLGAELRAVPFRRRRVAQPGNGESVTSRVYRRFAGDFASANMFPYLLQFPNPEARLPDLDEHNGEEFCYVLDGELELSIYKDGSQVSEVLHAGDSVYLDSTVPHRWHGRGSNPYADTSAEIIHVFWCPLGEAYLFES